MFIELCNTEKDSSTGEEKEQDSAINYNNWP